MRRIPERLSLVAQLADVLRQRIQEREWKEFLPGQRSLSEQLHVSRPTLRAALKVLVKEGYLEIIHRQRIRVALSATRPKTIGRSKVVAILSPNPLDNLSYLSLYLICQMQRHLADAGFQLEIHTERRLSQRHPFKALETMLHQIKAACWVLHFSLPEIPQWFSDRGLPAVVFGTCSEGPKLPSVDLDYRAIGRHAGGMFLRMGHRRVRLLLNKSPHAGELAVAQGFQEVFQASPHWDGGPLIARSEFTVAGVGAMLKNEFGKANPPTALLANSPSITLAALGHLANAGIRVPHDVSVVCRYDDPVLAFHVPSIARYVPNWKLFAAKLNRLVVQCATFGHVRPQQVRLMPEFLEGDTLRPPRDNKRSD